MPLLFTYQDRPLCIFSGTISHLKSFSFQSSYVEPKEKKSFVTCWWTFKIEQIVGAFKARDYYYQTFVDPWQKHYLHNGYFALTWSIENLFKHGQVIVSLDIRKIETFWLKNSQTSKVSCSRFYLYPLVVTLIWMRPVLITYTPSNS